MLNEVINWHLARGGETKEPDEGLVVMVNVPEASEPIWLGYLDAGEWRYPDGSLIEGDVEHWAEMPEGPDGPRILRPRTSGGGFGFVAGLPNRAA